MPVFVGCEWNFDNLIDLHAHLLALADAAIAWLNGFDKWSISAAQTILYVAIVGTHHLASLFPNPSPAVLTAFSSAKAPKA